MTDLDKARGWAEDGKGLYNPGSRTKAVIDIILSLPDQWVDVEKVREVINGQLSVYTRGTASHYIAEEITRNLKALIAPKPPTLDDMTEDGRKACQWMQADVKIDDGKRCVITAVHGRDSVILFPDGTSLHWNNNLITPRIDLPKLQWPSSIAQEPTGASLDPQENIDASIEYIKKTASDQQPNTSETPKSSIKPEDVPPNEPWLIEANGTKAIGTRYKGDAVLPWFVAALDGSFADDYHDNAVTLIHKLVPETHTLPEGMRLADHETLGRIVVSQRADEDGDYAFFESIPGGIAGASWGYVNESELTFLDGGN